MNDCSTNLPYPPSPDPARYSLTDNDQNVKNCRNAGTWGMGSVIIVLLTSLSLSDIFPLQKDNKLLCEPRYQSPPGQYSKSEGGSGSRESQTTADPRLCTFPPQTAVFFHLLVMAK